MKKDIPPARLRELIRAGEWKGPTSLAYIGDNTWSNYRLEFDFMIEENNAEPSAIFILVRDSEDSKINYGFGIDFHKDTVNTYDEQFVLLVLGNRPPDDDGIYVYEDLSKNLEKDQWYSIEIEVEDGHLSFSINDMLLIDYYDENYISNGRVSIMPIWGTYCFDNVRVTAIGNSD